MAWMVLLSWTVRWVHITCAVLAVGAPFFVRFALMPAAAAVLDEAAHEKLRNAINARWRYFVYVLISLFILTGCYNFFVESSVNGVLITARWKQFGPEDQKIYQMLFGINMLAALGMFFLASALAGRAAVFAPIRKNARVAITLLLLLSFLAIICATLMHMLPLHGAMPESG